MNKSTRTDSVQTYEDRARQMTAEQREALKRVVSEKFSEIQSLALNDRATAVRGLNTARELGQQIEMFTGHEKLLPSEFEQLSPVLADASLEFAKTCLALHRKYPEAVTEYSEKVQDEWKFVKVQLDLLPASERGAAKTSGIRTEVEEYLSTVIRASQSYKTLCKEMPLDKWDPFYLEALVREGRPVHDMVEAAVVRLEQLRKG